jgi:hypothetical protein
VSPHWFVVWLCAVNGKVCSLLRQSVCVSIVDLVSVRHANLYVELLSSLNSHDPALPQTLRTCIPLLFALVIRDNHKRHSMPGGSTQ